MSRSWHRFLIHILKLLMLIEFIYANPPITNELSNPPVQTLTPVTVLLSSETDSDSESEIGYVGQVEVLPGHEDKPLSVFKGIPYGQAPIAGLRYKPPVPFIETELRNVSEFPPPCLQWDLFTNKNVTGSEDCLHLNLYKPKAKPDGNETTLYPVMVFFHGVGFIAGQSDTYNPEYLVFQNVIVITVQYRLGALGFLSTGDALQPGNMGLLDQVEALRWIQRNVKYFDGDPEKVTIFGESAGAVSVSLHMLSPLTKGLFRAAIIQSGTAIAPYAIQRNPMVHVQRLAANLGCISGNSTLLLECIKYSDPNEVVASDAYTAAGGLGRKANRSYKKPPNPGPVIQTEPVKNWPTYLGEDPITILSEARFHQVPVIIGVNRDESASAVISNLFPKLINATLNDPTYPERSFLKKIVKSSGFRNNTEVIKAAIKFEYFKDYNMSDINELKDEYISLHSDFSVVAPVYMTALYFSQTSKVYFYTFEYEGDMSFSQILTQSQTVDNEPQEKRKRKIEKRDLVGNTFHITPEIAAELEQISQEIYHIDETRYVIHGEELLYVFRFRNPSNGVMVDIADQEGKHVRQIVTTLWTNMAKYSNPTEVLTPEVVSINWKPFTQDGPYTMKIAERISPLISYRHRKMLFWTHHVQQLGKLQLCS